MSSNNKKSIPSIRDIVNAAAEVHNVDVEAITQMSRARGEVAKARISAIFVAAKAGYSNQKIAEALSYKQDNTVMAHFEKMNGLYSRPFSGDEAVVTKLNKIAKTVGVSLG